MAKQSVRNAFGDLALLLWLALLCSGAMASATPDLPNAGTSLAELENLALGEQELEQLEQEHKTLSNAEQLLGTCRQVLELCSESDAGNVLSALTASLNRLGTFSNQPGALSEATNLLASAQIQVEEAVGELNRFIDHFDADPQRQQQLEDRSLFIQSLGYKDNIVDTRMGFNCRIR